MGDIIRDLQLPRCPVRTPARPAPRGPHPFVLPTARPAPARTKLAPGPLGPLRGLHAVPGWRTLGPGSRPPGPPAPYLPRPGRHGEAARVARGRRSRACARRAAGRLNPLLAALRPRPHPRPWGARTGPPGRPPPSARAYLPRRGRARGSIWRRGARTLRGPGRRRGGTGRREPGWISRFHPDSPSALPADSVLLGDHVTRAAFDPGLGAGRGRGPGPEGCQTRDPRGRCARASVPEAMTPSKQSPGETNKLFGVREGLALGVGEAAEGRRGAQRHALAGTFRPGIACWAPGLRVLPRWPVTTLQGSSDNRYLSM